MGAPALASLVAHPVLRQGNQGYEDSGHYNIHDYSDANPYNFHTISPPVFDTALLNLEKIEKEMTMKKFLVSLLVIVLALGLLGAVAYAGYRYGFTQGMAAASNGDSRFLGPGLGMGPNRMPMHEFGLNRGFDRDGFVLMNRGFGFGFFPLLGILLQLLVLGLIIWGIYVLIKRSGWRLARTGTAATTPAVEPIPPASTEEDQRS